MNGKLVDTNIIIKYIKGEEKLYKIFSEGVLYYSIITLGELLYGCELFKNKEYNKAVYKDFCGELIPIFIDNKVIDQYARIKSQLKVDGHPIPENDIWIAACAASNNLIVVTSDKHFEYIKNLQVDFLF